MWWTVLELWYYLSTLVGFYGYLIPRIGSELKQKCLESRWCSHQLRRTVWGYSVDLSDGQWREFRETLPLLIVTAAAGVLLHSIFLWVRNKTGYSWLKSTHYNLFFGLIVIVVQHGYHCIIVLLISYGAYLLTMTLRGISRKIFLVVVYLYAASIILLKESYRVQFTQPFQFLQVLFDRRYSGLYSWHIPANFLVLRLVSFMLDCHWAYAEGKQLKKEDSLPAQKISSGDGIKCEKYDESGNDAQNITSEACALHEYNFINFLSYCVYAPLYVAGPILTFNSYIKYTHKPQKTENVSVYALRWMFAFCLMELGTSFFPFFAITKTGLYRELSPSQLAILAYCTLKLMWLKFLLIWRFFRLWALADGVCPPENQLRCMSNNHSIGQFWKGWHASFNQWLVRYMYIPLGGRQWSWLNVWPIFFFVALWHDIEPKLMLWGALNAGFYIIEIIGKYIGNSAPMERMPAVIRCALETLGSASFIMVLIAVNMTGYAVGSDGVQFMMSKVFTRGGAATVFWSFYILTSGVCIMRYLKQKKLSR